MARIAIVNLASLPMPGNEPIFPIGPRCVQATLNRAGHETLLVDFVEHPEAYAELEWARERWDIIGFSIRNIDPLDLSCDGFVPHYLDFITRVNKAAGAPSPLFVGGGPGYSLFANSLIGPLGLDVGVIGPGEQSMLDIAADPAQYRGLGRNILGQRYTAFMTDELTHPRSLMSAYTQLDEAMIGIETRRKTCYQECVYCPYAYISGHNDGDLKPLDLICDELRNAYDAGIRQFFFTDAIFNSELRFAKEIAGAVADLALADLRWSGYFTPKPFDDEFAELLAASRVQAVLLSPDSLDVDMMKVIGKRFDTRHVTRCIERCRRNNLDLRVSLVFGGPGESKASVRASADYVNSHLRSDELVLNVGFRVLPATSLARQLDLSDDELVEPTFYPFQPDLFSWIIQSFDSRFLTTDRLVHLMMNNIATKRMAKLAHRHDVTEGSASMPYLALRRSAANKS